MTDMGGRPFGGQNMVGRLRRVLVRPPTEAFAVTDPARWNYSAVPDLEIASREHAALVEILRREGAEIVLHDVAQPGRADAVFVFDPVLMTDRGAIVLRMGKRLRRGEEGALAARLEQSKVPVLFELSGDALAEGGDCLWLDRKTLAVGRGFRTNDEGIRQLSRGLSELGVEVVTVELPYYTGPRACLHLLSLISLLDHDLAVVYPGLIPVSFWERLRDRGIQLVEVPDAEFGTMGPNVLALAPRRSLMLEGNPITRQRLEDAGCEVLTYRGREISLKAEGGPTCLTQPLLRDS